MMFTLRQMLFFFSVSQQPNSGPGRFSGKASRSYTIRYTASRTPPNEWSARRRRYYLHNTHKEREIKASMPSTVFKPTIPTIERQQNCVRPHCHPC